MTDPGVVTWTATAAVLLPEAMANVLVPVTVGVPLNVTVPLSPPV